MPDWFTNYDKEKSRKDTVDKLKAELRQKTKHKERLKKLKQDGASVHWKAKRKVHYTLLLLCSVVPVL